MLTRVTFPQQRSTAYVCSRTNQHKTLLSNDTILITDYASSLVHDPSNLEPFPVLSSMEPILEGWPMLLYFPPIDKSSIIFGKHSMCLGQGLVKNSKMCLMPASRPQEVQK